MHFYWPTNEQELADGTEVEICRQQERNMFGPYAICRACITPTKTWHRLQPSEPQSRRQPIFHQSCNSAKGFWQDWSCFAHFSQNWFYPWKIIKQNNPFYRTLVHHVSCLSELTRVTLSDEDMIGGSHQCHVFYPTDVHFSIPGLVLTPLEIGQKYRPEHRQNTDGTQTKLRWNVFFRT